LYIVKCATIAGYSIQTHTDALENGFSRKKCQVIERLFENRDNLCCRYLR